MRAPLAWLGVVVLAKIILVVGWLALPAISGAGDDEPLVVPTVGAPGTGSDEPAGRPTVWHGLTVDGDRLRISYEGSACQESNNVVVEEGPERVVVTVHTRVPPVMCIMVAVGYDVVAELDSPLAGRPVYDGACLASSAEPAAEECRRTPDQPGSRR